MSELFTGITFPQQKITPSDDAAIRRAALADGILNGCALNYAGSTLTMGAGLLLGCGRQFRHTAVQNWAVTGANSGYARLVLTIDTTRASTKDSFDQIVDTIEYASSLDGFLQLQQDDINEAGTIYQMAVCVVSLGAGGITGIVSKLKVLNASKLSMDLLWQNASPTSEFAAQDIPVDWHTDYEMYIAIFRAAQSSNYRITIVAARGEYTYVHHRLNTSSDTVDMIFLERTFLVSDNGYIRFSDCRNRKIGSESTANNTRLIPTEIYGIKGVSA